MKFEYRSTLINRETGRAENRTEVLDTETWLEHAKANKTGLYANSGVYLQEHLVPLLDGSDLMALNALYFDFYDKIRKVNGNLVFEFAMFTWAGFKAGRYSADVWATVLANAWQAGSRGMMAAVRLPPALVIEMFKAAPRQVLQEFGSYEDEDMNAAYDQLPDSFQVFRGVSTGIDHYEDGFSWTLDAHQAKTFMALNTQSKKEIPGVVMATIAKDAALALFSHEKEVVVDPTVPKLEVFTYFLRGKDLRNFHKSVDVDRNTQDVMFQTGYEAKRMAVAARRGIDGAPAAPIAAAVGNLLG